MNTHMRPLTIIEISSKDLPVRCFAPGTAHWNGHPLVYLALNSDRTTHCPYCGTTYKLVGEYKPHH